MKKNKLSKDLLDLMEHLDWFFEIRYHDRTICYEENDSGGISAKIVISDDYKTVELFIYPIFFRQIKKEQKKILLHEYVHTILDPVHSQMDNALNDKFISKESVRVALESTTCAITERLSSLLEGNSKFMVEAYKKII